MPAARAVLRDIHDLGLDPAKPWNITDKGGRLTATPKAGAKPGGQHINQRTLPAPAKPEVKVETKPVPNALKELPKEPEKASEEVTVVASSKKKKDAPAAPPAPETPVVAAPVEVTPPPPPPPVPVAAVEEVVPVEKPTDEKPVS